MKLIAVRLEVLSMVIDLDIFLYLNILCICQFFGIYVLLSFQALVLASGCFIRRGELIDHPEIRLINYLVEPKALVLLHFNSVSYQDEWEWCCTCC